jgi:hypothetical protein
MGKVPLGSHAHGNVAPPLQGFIACGLRTPGEAKTSVQRLPLPPDPRQLLDRLEDPAPYHGPVDVALIKQLISPLGCTYRRILSMLVHEQLRGAEYIGVVDQSVAFHFLSTRLLSFR